MRVNFGEVPLDVRRRAARYLEAVRGTPMARGAAGARLGDEVCPLYRPDVKGVAYWEFELLGAKAVARNGVGTNGAKRRASDRGFLVVSTGPHDVPVPHWSVELEPPSRTLEAHAKAKDKPLARVLKLDTLCYAGEDAKGTYVSHLGQFPPMPSGLPTTPPKEPALTSAESRPATQSESDKRVGKQAVKQTPARPPKPKLEPWPSWAQAKKQYGAAYKLHLGVLRARADQAWQVEALVAKLGEGIHEGDKLVVPLLKPGKAQISGPGAASVTMRMLDRVPPAVELTAGGAKEQKEQEFQLELSYADGTSETLRYFVVPKGTPSNRRRALPHPVDVLPPRPS